jgi:hypothetical protein
VGAQSVQAKIDGNEKENLTAVASVGAAGEELPLEFIATGKTICIDQVDGHWRSHSQNKRETSETFENYLINLRIALGNGSIHLLLDSYSAYRTDAM